MTDTTALHSPAGTLYGYFTDTIFAPDHKQHKTRLVQLLPGQGCTIWLTRKSDCCIFCRLPAGTRYAVLGDGYEDHFEPWTVAAHDYVAMIDTSLAQAPDVDSIICFNGGSFLSDKEIPQATRAHLYQAVKNHPTAQELMIEARPELVTDAMLREAQAHLGGKTLKVAIGLESMNEHVRNDILKKFIGQDSFLRALARLQNHKVKSFVYVFLGAPGLSEAEAYRDARASIKALAALGVDEIALSCAFIPPGGQLETLYQAGDYRPPWLWTVGTLIEDAIAHNWPLSVGGFDDFPPPVAIAQNCGACDKDMLAAIDGYRQTGQFNAPVQCGCKDTWQAVFNG